MPFFKKQPKPIQITVKDAAERAQRGEIALVDVREPSEIRDLAPAVKTIQIPLGALGQRFQELPKDRPVAFICAAGGRSSTAAKAAVAAEIDALNVTGGMAAWSAAGLPTKAGA